MRRLIPLLIGSCALLEPPVHAFLARPTNNVRLARHRQPNVSNRQPLRRSATASSEDTGEVNHVLFEYCTGCRWQTRAFWMAQELLTTFNDDNLSAVTITPSNPPPGARFVVSHFGTSDADPTVLWDRAEQGSFPELKELKRLLRDKISPERYLGHSDDQERQDSGSMGDGETTEAPSARTSTEILTHVLGQAKATNVAIQYCTGCRWMLRAAYFGTELMTTFGHEIDSLTLIPSRPPEEGGVFVS